MIRPHSKARQKQLREYLKNRAVYLLARPACETHWQIWGGAFPPTPQKSIDIHHVRGRTGSLLIESKFWKAVCRACHCWIQDNPTQARERGLLAPLGQWNQTEKLRQQKERNANQTR